MENQDLCKKRGRPRKEVEVIENPENTEEDQNSSSKRRGRPRKKVKVTENSEETEINQDLDRSRKELRSKAVSESTGGTADKVGSKEKVKQLKRDLPSKSQWKRIIGTLPGYIIPTQRLPFNRVVLQRFAILRESMSNSTSTHTFSELLYDEILPIWKKANIPVVEKRLCLYRLEELIKSWTKNNCRKMVEGSNHEKNYTNMLDSLCSMTYLDSSYAQLESREQLKSL